MAAVTRFLVWTAILVALVLGLLRLVAIRWIRLPENDPVLETSVLPTLEGGDLIVLWRLSKPAFGDLVLCPEPQFPTRFVIGRIAGLPGDAVALKDGAPFVNGKPFVLDRSCEPTTFRFTHPDRPSEEVEQGCSWESMGGGMHTMGYPQIGAIVPEDRKYEVPDGQWFLLSDNRHFSYDSRDYGFVDASSCKELVVARLVSRRGWSDAARRLTYIQ